MKDFQIITLVEMQRMLSEKNGAQIITLTTITKAELKKDSPYKDVRKVSKINGIVNWHYAQAVNRQRTRESKEPDFKALQRSWGTRLDNSPFVSHVRKDGEHHLYLEVKVERVLSVEYSNDEKGVIPLERIQKYLKEKSSNGKQHQGVEKEVILRDYDVRNIVMLEMNGMGYILRNRELL